MKKNKEKTLKEKKGLSYLTLFFFGVLKYTYWSFVCILPFLTRSWGWFTFILILLFLSNYFVGVVVFKRKHSGQNAWKISLLKCLLYLVVGLILPIFAFSLAKSFGFSIIKFLIFYTLLSSTLSVLAIIRRNKYPTISELAKGDRIQVFYRNKNTKEKLKGQITILNLKDQILTLKSDKDLLSLDFKQILKVKRKLSPKIFKLKIALWILIILCLGYCFKARLFHTCGPAYWPDGQWMCAQTWQCQQGRCGCHCDGVVAMKPIVYLYPETTINVKVELGYPQNTTHTYPKYNAPWQVQAKPNGNLTDLKTGRHYYALYWEGKNIVSTQNPSEGFVIKGENTISFLEEKLDQLGLTEREAEEFIVYWLPKLENAPYNFIRFQSLEEQNKNMPLIITPNPTTLIRVMMEYSNLNKPIEIKEQVLPPKPERIGFTVVEWGGTEIHIGK